MKNSIIQSQFSDRQTALQYEICKAFDIGDQERFDLLKALWVHRYGLSTFLQDEELKGFSSANKEVNELNSDQVLKLKKPLGVNLEDQSIFSDNFQELVADKKNNLYKESKQLEIDQDGMIYTSTNIEEEVNDVNEFINKNIAETNNENLLEKEIVNDLLNSEEKDLDQSGKNEFIKEEKQSENKLNKSGFDENIQDAKSSVSNNDHSGDSDMAPPPPPPPPSINEFRRWLK
ncbi:hypothetical protein [Prochlorococcus sp. MIT 1223]|uniref:hypothetical protein n=1 Tax=Prochlorococcus sp. MIT 1223 TaxID=3096217 RepID=UPI002A75D5F3|nr:hypothetical protein [Prochlorococcus sp. MIT 1223]